MKPPPSVLLLCADMASAVHFSCYGGPAGLTPAVDALAAGGVRFVNGYCACPPCIPARASMMCGQYAHTHGKSAHLKMPLAPQPPLLPELLAANGYRTGIVGKTHWWPPDASLGCRDTFLTIDNHLSPELGHRDAYLRFLRDQGLFSYDPATWMADREKIEARNLPFGCTKVNWTGDTACRLLEEYARGADPFFLFCSFVEPHGGSKDALRNAPRDLRSQVEAVPLPPIVEDSGEHKPAPHRRAVRELWDRPAHEKDAYRRDVFNDIALVDRNIGKILQKVDSLGLRDDLLVLFTTDHGDLMFDHGCIEKTILFERSIRVPFIARGPGVPVGESRRQFASHVDLLPTVLDYAGVPEQREWNIEGRSLLPVVRDGGVQGRGVPVLRIGTVAPSAPPGTELPIQGGAARRPEVHPYAGGRSSAVRGAVRSGRGPGGAGQPGSIRPLLRRAGSPAWGVAALAHRHRDQPPAPGRRKPLPGSAHRP